MSKMLWKSPTGIFNSKNISGDYTPSQTPVIKGKGWEGREEKGRGSVASWLLGDGHPWGKTSRYGPATSDVETGRIVCTGKVGRQASNQQGPSRLEGRTFAFPYRHLIPRKGHHLTDMCRRTFASIPLNFTLQFIIHLYWWGPDRERTCADTTGTVLVPCAGHFQCWNIKIFLE